MKEFLQTIKQFKNVFFITFMGILCYSSLSAQTMENPIIISFKPINSVVKQGSKSALILKFKVPLGYWLGSNDRSARNPAPTIIEIDPINGFIFEEPLFPKTVARGVPVHKGYSYIFDGEVNVVIPFKTLKSLNDGSYKITSKITYTPGLNAGQLRTQIKESYSATVFINNNTNILQT